MTDVIDVEFARSNFPAFEVPALKNQAFFENAGGSYTCMQVIERLEKYYRECKVQPYAPYEASQLAGRQMDESRARLSAMLGVDEDEIGFGPSTTQNAYVLAQAFRQWLDSGEAIIVTNQDHEANSGPWRRLADSEIEIREWRINAETGLLELEELERLLDDKVRLVCFPHCSNIVGAENPIVEITAISHAAGAFVCVDGVSYAPHGFINVGDTGPDVYMFSSYKTYGPHQGIMVIRRSLGEMLPNQGHWFNAGELYRRFTPAGPDHAQIAACAGMADYYDSLAKHHGVEGTVAERAKGVHDLLRAHERIIIKPLLDYLSTKNSVRLIGPDETSLKVPTVAVELSIPGIDAAEKLADFDIMAGGGDFYGTRPLQALGINIDKGVLRLSLVHYNSSDDVDRLLNALEDVI
ncbi:MAG: aminotransferase class V-fold PLP-dependent enzyme [Roseovarius sp.]|nr:aminotransferase class V-fold PLP-dependent enzyme [Roseovarius sp.]